MLHRTDHRAFGRPVRRPRGSLHERLTVDLAGAVLAALTGCRQVDAARSIRATAARLGRSMTDVAGCFLDALDASADDEQAVALVLTLAVQAVEPPGRADPAPGGPVVACPPGPPDGSFVVDLSRLTSVDAPVLKALHAITRDAADAGSLLTVVPPTEPLAGRLLAVAVRLRWLSPAFVRRRP